MSSGVLVIRGNFSAMWQDNRKYGNNNAELRLGFRPKMSGQISHAEAQFEFTFSPYESTPLDLTSVMNMGFKDDVADDQQGG